MQGHQQQLGQCILPCPLPSLWFFQGESEKRANSFRDVEVKNPGGVINRQTVLLWPNMGFQAWVRSKLVKFLIGKRQMFGFRQDRTF